ncbi:MAG: DUF86 domain-containing protein [Candidatus Margulisiibacteriota bacterium]
MALRDDSAYINHILDAITKIESYLSGISYDAFIATTLIQDGIIRQIKIIGEASGNISDKFKESNPDIPWADIVGMRNKLIHQYFGVDIDAVWETSKKDVPELKEKIEKLR